MAYYKIVPYLSDSSLYGKNFSYSILIDRNIISPLRLVCILIRCWYIIMWFHANNQRSSIWFGPLYVVVSFLFLVMASIHTIFWYCYAIILGQFDVILVQKFLKWSYYCEIGLKSEGRNEEGSLTWGIRAIYSIIFLDFFYSVKCRRAPLDINGWEIRLRDGMIVATVARKIQDLKIINTNR